MAEALTTRSCTRSQPAQAKLYQSINDKSQMLALRSGYRMSPSAQVILAQGFTAQNLSIHHGDTSVYWHGPVDLSNLKVPLRQIVQLGRTHIEIYPKDNQKPSVGRQLNRQCLATFRGFERINVKRLQNVCRASSCRVAQIDEQTRIFVVQIPHFTKYGFGAVEKEEESKANPLPTDPSTFISSILDRHRQELNEERRLRAKILNLTSTRGNRNRPGQQQNQDITARFHHAPEQLEQGSIAGSSRNNNFSSDILYYHLNSHLLKLGANHKSEVDARGLETVIKLLQNDEVVIQYVFNEGNPFAHRRLLALYLICCNFKACLFDFREDENGRLTIVSNPFKKIKEYERSKYVKEWLLWVMQNCPEIIVTKNEIHRGLCLKNIQSLVAKCLDYDKFEDAEFISCIEDEFYRLDSGYPSRLCKQLKCIAIRDFSPFQSEHWLCQLAVFLWYYNFVEDDETFMNNILNKECRDDAFFLEKHVFKVIYGRLSSSSLSPDADIENNDLAWRWFLSMKMQRQEETLFEGCGRDYHSYRYDLLDSLLHLYSQDELAAKILSMEAYLPTQSKEQAIIEYSRGHKSKMQYFHKRKLLSENSLNELAAHQAYQCGRYLQTLRVLASLPKLAKKSREIVIAILESKEILFSFHFPTNRQMLKYLKLLEKGPNNLNKQIHPYRLYLELKLGVRPLEWADLESLVALTESEMQQNDLRKQRIHDVLKRGISGNPLLQQSISSDAGKQGQIKQLFSGRDGQLGAGGWDA